MTYDKIRESLASAGGELRERFLAGESVVDLVHARAAFIDDVLVGLWRDHLEATGAALVAVGGYGRGELMPGSDIDLMLLMPDAADERVNRQAEALLTFLWDIGLEVGHSVRTVTDCVEQSLADITVVTNLMESRLLAGSRALYDAMEAATSPARLWNSRDFFEAKVSEQHARHRKYHDTGYNLEPNIKEGPGGLRDIQMIT